MSVSIDGFVGGPKGELDWIFETYDEDATAWTIATLWDTGVHIMGSHTFHDMAAYWPSSTEPFAAPMNEIPKVVFSRRSVTTSPKTGSWENARVASGDLAEEIARLKREPGKFILAHGGAGFAQSLVQLGLVDEFRLLIHPVALGTGLPLFSKAPKPISLKLLSSTRFPSGSIANVYECTFVSLPTSPRNRPL
jgi:dihydrofolate reductase